MLSNTGCCLALERFVHLLFPKTTALYAHFPTCRLLLSNLSSLYKGGRIHQGLLTFRNRCHHLSSFTSLQKNTQFSTVKTSVHLEDQRTSFMLQCFIFIMCNSSTINLKVVFKQLTLLCGTGTDCGFMSIKYKARESRSREGGTFSFKCRSSHC